MVVLAGRVSRCWIHATLGEMTGKLHVTPLISGLLMLAFVQCSSSEQAVDGVRGGSSQTEALFNGQDLTGWNGDPLFWRVENGAIVGETSEESPTHGNTFLIWSGGTVEDFRLSLEFKLTNHNSGIQYRSKVLEGWRVGGYQADLDEANRFTGMLYEEGGRGFIARRGQNVVVDDDGMPREVGAVGDPDELASHIEAGEWNSFEITAEGNHLVHRVNGHVTAEAMDNDPVGRSFSGLIALQLHAGPPMRVEFRNIMLTRL